MSVLYNGGFSVFWLHTFLWIAAGKAGIFGLGGQQPSAAEDTKLPNVGEAAKNAVTGTNPTPTSTKPSPSPKNEVAKVAEGPAGEAVEEAAEAARTLIPSPDGLISSEKAAQNAESQEKRAVNAPGSSFKAASPVGGEVCFTPSHHKIFHSF